MPTADLGDVTIYYESQGSGDAVLLCPPSWWPCDTWNVGVVPFLSKKFRTIIFDCRGTGYSSKPDHGYTIEQFAKDCAGLLEFLKISRCHAAGFALGGQIAQALAIQRPELVATVTIAAAGAGAKSDRRRTASGAEHRRRGDSRAWLREVYPWPYREHPYGVRRQVLRAHQDVSKRCPMRFGNAKPVRSSTAIISMPGAPGTPWEMRQR
jgi:pimeloyl-ACP methyl ester carboxylesterase